MAPRPSSSHGEPVTDGRLDLSVILPAYNEAVLIPSRLERILHHLSRRDGTWEVVVVDDGSTDDTAAKVSAVASSDPRVRLVSLAANEGKGGALIRGTREARGRILATTDADLSYALADLDAVIAAVGSGADLATGNRRHPRSRINLPFGLFSYLVKRWIAGGAFRLLVRLLFRIQAPDTQCGLKAFSAVAAEEIFPRLITRRFLADIEIFLIARDRRLRLADVPVHLRYLSAGTTVRIARGLAPTFIDLARIKLAEIRGAYR